MAAAFGGGRRPIGPLGSSRVGSSLEQVSVVPGHLAAEQVAGVADWEPLADALAAARPPVLVDVGRLHAGSPLVGVAARADVVVVVGRPDTASVIRLRERLIRLVPALAAHRGAAPRLFPVLVCPVRHGAADVADLARILADTPAGPLIIGCGFLGLDPGAVTRLEAGENPRGRLARTSLLRTARALVSEIGARVEPRPRPAATSVREGV